MKRPLRPVFLTCGLVMVVLAMPAAQQPANRPNKVRILVDNKGISQPDNGKGGSKVWARAGGVLVFEIKNEDKVAHQVSIPIAEFKPSDNPAYYAKATEKPLVEPQKDTLTVQPGKTENLELKVKPVEHFGFDTRPEWAKDQFKNDPEKSKGMTYKYTVYTTPAGGKRIPLDPDVEINRP
jgi:hypothetical protein